MTTEPVWLTTKDMAALLSELRQHETSPMTALSWARTWYRGEVRKAEPKPGRVASNLYDRDQVIADHKRSKAEGGRGGPGRPRKKRTQPSESTTDGTTKAVKRRR